jgi:hypothetical protein
MQIYKKGLRVQILLFGIFVFMGLNIILNHYLLADFPWISFLGFPLLIAAFVFGIIMYRSKDQSVSIITPKEVKTIKYLMYGYFLIYLARLVIAGNQTVNQEIISLVSGIALMLIATVGIYIQVKIYKDK